MPSEVRKIRYSIGCKNEERIHISVWKMHTTLLTQSLHIDKSRFTYWLFAGDSVGRVHRSLFDAFCAGKSVHT